MFDSLKMYFFGPNVAVWTSREPRGIENVTTVPALTFNDDGKMSSNSIPFPFVPPTCTWFFGTFGVDTFLIAARSVET